MTNVFWRLAYKLYARRNPSIWFELLAIGFVGFMALIYAYAVSVNPITGNIIRLLVAVLIVSIGFAHRRVRLERAKGAEALSAKAMTRNG
ncbi:hypothetical protein [Sphingomonas sp.]|uniref:hypothetical protein n=1 Tax=Sphingomonas sp. TaxID=28214 RepID=UPI003B001E04